MANTKKELIQTCQDLIVDIFDCYDDYKPEDKELIQIQINGLITLNTSLKGYEQESKQKPKWLIKLEKAFNDYFGKK